MTTILDTQLYAHTERLQGKVVLITGERDVPWLSAHSLRLLISPSLCRGRSRHWERNCSAVCEVEVRSCVCSG